MGLAGHTRRSIHEGFHPSIVALFIAPRNLPDTFISRGEESDREQAQYQR
jgi:hypothetical protein